MTSLSKKEVKSANKMILSHKAPKKRGRPVGSRNKKKPAAQAKSFKQPSTAWQVKLQNRILELEMIRERLHSLVDRMENKEIQYQAVINYLETKLELN